MTEPVLHRFETWDALVTAACERIADALSDGIDARGAAAMALAGGTTPGDVYRRLSTRPLDWRRVQVTLTDERWTAPDAPGSNARLQRETLLQGPAAAAVFLSLRSPAAADPEQAAAEADRALAGLAWPLDVALLGMGLDGHTASLFPGSPALPAALDDGDPNRCVAVPAGAPAPPEPRLTLTARALLDTRLLLLVIRGADKLAALERARQPGADLPISVLLRRAGPRAVVYWAP